MTKPSIGGLAAIALVTLGVLGCQSDEGDQNSPVASQASAVESTAATPSPSPRQAACRSVDPVADTRPVAPPPIINSWDLAPREKPSASEERPISRTPLPSGAFPVDSALARRQAAYLASAREHEEGEWRSLGNDDRDAQKAALKATMLGGRP